VNAGPPHQMTPNNPLASLTPAQIAGLWRTSPAALASKLSRRQPAGHWQQAPHLNVISQWVVDAAMGRRPRIIINCPPRHGKSELISKWVPVWFLENFPHKNVINTGYATDFSEKWGGQVRNLVTDHKDQLSFQLAQDSKAKGYWRTKQGGGMVATGIKGQITGLGAHLFVIDDPVKDFQDANSRVSREYVWDWWRNTARTRFEPGCAVIILMTRWHEDDMVGRLLADMATGGEHWDVLNLPAISGKVQTIKDVPLIPENWIEDPDAGPCPLGRKPGQALWPWRYSLNGSLPTPTAPQSESLNDIRRSVSEEAWVAQYQGQPANLVGAGNVYKSFSAAGNVGPTLFNPLLPLCWSMDFNVDPMCSTFSQYVEEMTPTTYLTNQYRKKLNVLQELILPNSSTPEMCETFLDRTQAYRQRLQGAPLKVRIYGDRSGQSRKTVGDTDYVSIKNFFRKHPTYKLTMHLSTSNPAVRDRVNAVNAMLCNAAGERNTTIDPTCTELIKDFRQVKWKCDKAGNSSGNIDKSDMERTHVSDALGYHVEKQFGLKNNSSPSIEQSGALMR
jgi:hypothetical protein